MKSAWVASGQAPLADRTEIGSGAVRGALSLRNMLRIRMSAAVVKLRPDGGEPLGWAMQQIAIEPFTSSATARANDAMA